MTSLTLGNCYYSSCSEINEFFDNNNITGAWITKDEYPMGLVMKHILNSYFTRYSTSDDIVQEISREKKKLK